MHTQTQHPTSPPPGAVQGLSTLTLVTLLVVQTSVSPRMDRLLALSPPQNRQTSLSSPGQTDSSLPQDGPLADFPFLCLASCFLLHYVQFVSAGLMEQELFPLSSTGSGVFPEITCVFLHFILC